MADINENKFFTLSLVGGEPDPYILLDIAPFIPPDLLPRAIQLALSIPYPDLDRRAATVESLARRLTRADDTLLEETILSARRFFLEKDVLEPALIKTLAPLLPVYLLPVALELSVGIAKYNSRINILAGLTACLTPADQESVFSSALDAIGSMPFEYHKAEALIILIAHFPPSVPLLDKAANIAVSMEDKERGMNVMAALVHFFRGKEKVSEYINEIRGSGILGGKQPEPDDIIPMPLREAPRKPLHKDRVTEDKNLLESMLRLPEFYLNIEYLVNLAIKLPGTERSEQIPKMLDTARSIESTNTKIRTLIELSRLIPPEDRQDLANEILELISGVHNREEKAGLSSRVIPLLPEELRVQLFPEIIPLIRTLKDEAGKFIMLESLIPFIPQTFKADILEIIDSFRNLRFRIKAFIKMTVYFSPSDFYSQMERALEAIAVDNDQDRTYLLKIFASILPDYLLKKALDLSAGIESRDQRARATSVILANIARLSEGAEKQKVLLDALSESFFTGIYGGGRGGGSEPISINITGKKAREFLKELPRSSRESMLKEWLGPVRKVRETTRDEMPVRSMKPVFRGKVKMEMPEEISPSQDRVVNTGFSYCENGEKLLKEIPLKCDASYYFWVEIGKLDLYSIEKTPIPLPVKDLPSDALLKVVLFSFRNEIEIVKGADIGELKLFPDGSVKVNNQPLGQTGLPTSLITDERLLFPVKAPLREGISRLRCNIYYERILVQARLITATVMQKPEPVTDALVSVVDYTLSHTLRPAHLKQLDPHRLSLMLNSNGDKTHALIFGQNETAVFKDEAVLSAAELKTPVMNARKALRKASWGDGNVWSGQKYKYRDQTPDINRLGKDLFSLAVSGYMLYNALIDKLTGSRKESYKLADLMLKPGMVQIALKHSPTQVIPAALFYDYPLDTQAKQFKLCDTFISAFRDKEPLEKTPCFNGACPDYDRLDHVCPSGFWGYRHLLGTPVSLGDNNDGRDVDPEIVVEGKTEIVAGVATNLDQLNDHMNKLKTLSKNLEWHYSENRSEIINLLKNIKSHIIYFYCHGQFGENNTLFLQVGGGNEYIEGSVLRANRILWNNPSPLVFINGCHTTAVDPEQAINLVQDFIGAGGSGVIGTEITIFESLACSFAEESLRLFLSGNSSIGEAVRGARLKLLKEGNPLGLVYIPFIIPSLRIKI